MPLVLVTADVTDPERGCLLVNAATERASHAPTVERVKTTMAVVEAVLGVALERAREHGGLRPGQQPVELARFLTAFVQGMRVMGNARADRAFPEAAVAASGHSGLTDPGARGVRTTVNPGRPLSFTESGIVTRTRRPEEF